jgi:imidazolonepropionase-like amidohydrolase
MTRIWIVVVAGLLALAGPLAAQRPIAIVGARIIDGNGGPPIESGVVVIRGDRIAAVGPAAGVPVPADAVRIDGRGRSVLPGLADLHVHLTGGWDGETTDLLSPSRMLSALLYAGVTTVFDTGNILPYILQITREIDAGRLDGPHIRFVGPVVDGANPVWPPLSLAVATPEQIGPYVRQLRAAGVKMVKGYGGLSTELLTDLVQAAARDTLAVVVDAWRKNGTLEIARTGIAAFAHLGTVPITPETVAYLRDHRIASLTTLAVYESFSRRRFRDLSFLEGPLLSGSFPPAFAAELRAFAEHPLSGADSGRARAAMDRLVTAEHNLKQLFDAGILLAAGTDAPYPGDWYGEGLHRELELIVEAGLTPLQALTLATRNAAQFLHESDWGTLEAGKRADVIVVRGDPSRRISDTRRVELVFKDGRRLDRSRLRFDPARDPGYRAAGAANATP